MPRTLRSITAGELIEALQDFDADQPVAFASDYGDHGHTEQVHAIQGDVEEREIEESAYSVSGFRVVDADAEAEFEKADTAVDAGEFSATFHGRKHEQRQTVLVIR